MKSEPLPVIKDRFPFRLGTTSFILFDDYLPNVRHLAPMVDDIELLFTDPSDGALPDLAAMQEIRRIADRSSLSFTIHLPYDRDLGASDDAARMEAVWDLVHVIERSRTLNPFAWILHPFCEWQHFGSDGPPGDWMDRFSASIDFLLEKGIPPGRLCLENLRPAFNPLESLVATKGLSVCLDVGHIVIYGHDLDDFLKRYGSRIRVLHLHGIRDGRDHCSLAWLDPQVLETLMAFLHNGRAQRIVTLEVLGQADLDESLRVMSLYIPGGTSCP
ncbi:MAG TPA: cobamide remodeling phosphodiesterase CbiR [Syntrophales bacterium]|nr:cobamide remodeling phosphodiesterase CbiR [Syntrophales bacterium]